MGVDGAGIRPFGRFPVGAKLEVADLIGEFIAFRVKIDGNPAYMVCGGIRVGNLLAQRGLYLEKLTGRGLAHMLGRDWFAHFTSSQDQARLRNHFSRMLASGEVANYIWPIEDLSGREHQIEWYNRPLTDEQEGIIGLLCIGHNVSERQAIEKEREQLIIDLQAALQKVKTLSGLLPICASCKKIRDDRGYWNQIEVYIQERSEADFSHGICPDCAKQLYPEIYDRLPTNSTAE